MHEDQKSIHKLSFTTNDHSRSKHQVCIRYTARHKIPHVVSRSRSDSTIFYRKHDDVADAQKHLEAGSGGALCAGTGRHAFHMLFLRVKTRCACPGHRLHIPHLVISVAARVISAPQQASQWNIFSSILFFTARLATKLDPQSVSLSPSFLLFGHFHFAFAALQVFFCENSPSCLLVQQRLLESASPRWARLSLPYRVLLVLASLDRSTSVLPLVLVLKTSKL